MFKKITSLLIAFCILFCLSACGTEETNSDASTITTSHIETGESEETENVESTSSATETTTTNVTQSEVSAAQSVTTKAEQQAQHIHRYAPATCLLPKTCSCGATAGVALGHSYENASCTSPKKCTHCGATQGSALGHNYVNNKCTRCGKVDSDSLPVSLNSLHLIDSSHYQFLSGSFTDSFGNQYSGAHIFTDLYNGAHPNEQENSYCVYNLNGKYSKFTGSIVAYDKTYNKGTYYINIYLDDRLVYSKAGITKATEKIDFNINVKGGQKLAICGGGKGGQTHVATLGIVNAQLTK